MTLLIPIDFTSQRLFLHRYHPEDAAAYFSMLQDNQLHLHEFMPAILVNVQNVEDVRAVIEWQIEKWESDELFIMGVWVKNSGEYVGEVYLANADWEVPCIEVGYFTVQNQGGKGYASEACREACRIAFERLRVRRVELQCAGDNEKSARVAQHCGFTLEGRLRERHHKKDGTTVDRLWYGLLRHEWQDLQEKISTKE
jgi:RimJ/RimL family protein N-acetyltransferase